MFHDGCTAGPLSGWLSAKIGDCCAAHDIALDHGFELATFWAANVDFARCVSLTSPVLALVAFAVVSSPIGLLLYRFGPKRP